MSAAADNFSWLGGAPSVFRLAAATNDSGWRRRRESAAEGSRVTPFEFMEKPYDS